METTLKGKHVIVTGASGGIGRTIADSFAKEGCRVTVHYHRNRGSAESLVQSLGAENAQAVQADLTLEEDVETLFKLATKEWGPVSVFVANAGDWPSDHATVDQLDRSRWDRTLAANLTSSYLCMKHFLRESIQHQLPDPSAVLIGSTAGLVGEAGHSDYASAKAALIHGLLPSLKNEFCRAIPGARINLVSPGWTLTPMTEKFAADDASKTRALQTIAMRKFGCPQDIANAVVFLASSAASHLTGQNMTVSGGMEGRVLYSPDETMV